MTTELDAPDPSPTALALAQALATRDGEGLAFTSQTKTESTARIVSRYIGQAQDIAVHLPAVTVKPGREELARTIDPRPWSEHHRPFRDFAEARTTAELIERDRESIRRIADDVLAILPGKTAAEAMAPAWDLGVEAAAEAIFGLEGQPRRGVPQITWRTPDNPFRADEVAGK